VVIGDRPIDRENVCIVMKDDFFDGGRSGVLLAHQEILQHNGNAPICYSFWHVNLACTLLQMWKVVDAAPSAA